MAKLGRQVQAAGPRARDPYQRNLRPSCICRGVPMVLVPWGRDQPGVAARAEAMAMGMDFRLLYDHELRLFHIGYNLSADRIDSHHYDLLATEARLASYFAIMKGDVPLEHWFFLGRPLAQMAGGLALVSWNGSMFEYLMPVLLLRSFPGTLLHESALGAIERQHRGLAAGVGAAHRRRCRLVEVHRSPGAGALRPRLRSRRDAESLPTAPGRGSSSRAAAGSAVRRWRSLGSRHR